MHGRGKHVDAKCHFLRDTIKDGVIELKYCNIQDQLADIFTNPLNLESFVKLKTDFRMEVNQCYLISFDISQSKGEIVVYSC